MSLAKRSGTSTVSFSVRNVFLLMKWLLVAGSDTTSYVMLILSGLILNRLARPLFGWSIVKTFAWEAEGFAAGSMVRFASDSVAVACEVVFSELIFTFSL